MKNSVVKKTTFGKLLDMLLPFYCRGCGKTGSLLCEDCKSDIKIIGRVQRIGDGKEEQEVLIQGADNNENVKKTIRLGEIEELFIGGFREGALKTLISDYKFKSVKKSTEVLVPILDEAVPEDLDAVIVPLPTIRKHIRERGFDHTLRLAEEFGKKRGLRISKVLIRANKTVQVGADEEMREKQAAEAYKVDLERFKPEETYLLLDDVWTTGASMRAAAKKLREAGAKRILGVSLSSCFGR